MTDSDMAVVTQIGSPPGSGTLLPNWLILDTARELGSDAVVAICLQLSREKLGDDEDLVEQRARQLVAEHHRRQHGGPDVAPTT